MHSPKTLDPSVAPRCAVGDRRRSLRGRRRLTTGGLELRCTDVLRRLLHAGVLITAHGTTALAQQTSEAVHHVVDAVAANELRDYGAPGMVVAVRRNGVSVLESAYGVANVETGKPMSTDMIGSVASVSKLVTAVTALVLVDDGLLDLDRPVEAYLPSATGLLGRRTLAQLLSNTGGLGEHTPIAALSPNGALAPVCDAMTDQAIVADADVAWGYSNTGFTLAGCVIEAVAGRPFPEVVANRVFEPVGMSRSTYSRRYAMTFPHALGHDPRSVPPSVRRPFYSYPQIMPAGELMSTVGDLSRLAHALMQDGVVDGERVLPSGILTDMGEVRGAGGPFLNGRRRYGFGLFVREHGGVRFLEHEGIYSGFGAAVVMVPSQGLSSVAIANGRFSAPVRTVQAGAEAAMGLAVSRTTWDLTDIEPDAIDAAIGTFEGPTSRVEIALVADRPMLLREDGSYPLSAHPHGHWEVGGDRALAPIATNWLELVVTRPGGPVEYIRIGWRLYRRVP